MHKFCKRTGGNLNSQSLGENHIKADKDLNTIKHNCFCVLTIYTLAMYKAIYLYIHMHVVACIVYIHMHIRNYSVKTKTGIVHDHN